MTVGVLDEWVQRRMRGDRKRKTGVTRRLKEINSWGGGGVRSGEGGVQI